MDIICSLPPDSCGCDENGTDNLLSLSEVCTILSISSATGKNWLRLGKLESCSTVGGKPVFRREYIDALLETLKSDTSVSLKKRRNKKQIKGVGIYKDYIECSEVNVEAVRQIIA
jgi:predicted site-specific integrase-resolvase